MMQDRHLMWSVLGLLLALAFFAVVMGWPA